MTAPQDFSYIGDELSFFARATNWKNYWFRMINPYLGPTVLEVGAGIGGTTRVLVQRDYERLLAIEPDTALTEQLQAEQARFPAFVEFRTATIADIDEQFDAILYIDVLEHIEAHAEELAMAAERLKPNGHLIVLSPAYQYLYNEFDEAIGHYRRYTRQTLLAQAPPSLELVRSFYLDCVGLMASLGNKWLLRKSQPTHHQIWMWDKLMVPPSNLLDPLIGYNAGRSVIAVWKPTPQ